MVARECGACAACCYVPAVPELAKDVFQDCPHSRTKLTGRALAPPRALPLAAPAATGCEIYATRPAACRDYRCLWLDDALGEDADRPDQLGLMFDLPTLISEHPDYAGVAVICAREVWTAARDGPRASGLLARLARAMVVRLTDPQGKTRLFGPRTAIELLARRAAARAEGDAG